MTTVPTKVSHNSPSRLMRYMVMPALILLAFLNGCGDQENVVNFGDGVLLPHVPVGGDLVDVVEVDLTQADLRLFWKFPDGSPVTRFPALEAWLAESSQELLFVTNAGIFGKDMVPLGLHVQGGTELCSLNTNAGEGNFFMEPNGVFFVDGAGARVVETEAYANLHVTPQLAAQSGPILVSGGELPPAFWEDSTNEYIRSGVGGTESDRVCFVVSRERVTFHAFASLFRDELRCPNALYLDGAISALHVPGRITRGKPGPFAAMIGAVRRKPGSRTPTED